MPKWLAYPTHATQAIPIELAFPAWVLLISLYILVTHLRSGAKV